MKLSDAMDINQSWNAVSAVAVSVRQNQYAGAAARRLSEYAVTFGAGWNMGRFQKAAWSGRPTAQRKVCSSTSLQKRESPGLPGVASKPARNIGWNWKISPTTQAAAGKRRRRTRPAPGASRSGAVIGPRPAPSDVP